MHDTYDCIVLGGGPAGTTTAALTARSGLRTLLVEREKVPRFHVGEVVLPAACGTLEKLELMSALEESRFVRASGMQLLGHTGQPLLQVPYAEPQGGRNSRSWHVVRSEFDAMLLEHAARWGAECVDRTTARQVLFDGERAYGVRLETQQGASREVRARVVVDATGQNALLARQLGFVEPHPRLKNVAIWGYYRGARRDGGEHGCDTTLLRTEQGASWFWFVPLPDDMTSIGVVADRDRVLAEGSQSAGVFEDELVKCPALVERLIHAQLVSHFRVMRDFSYRTARQAGDGWVLVGDACGYVDPILSASVHLSLASGELAAEAIVDACHSGDVSAQSLGRWTPGYTAALTRLEQLALALYTPDFRLDAFLGEHPQHVGPLADLLMGHVLCNAGDSVLAEMKALRGPEPGSGAPNDPTTNEGSAP
jgi:flavin-dependent dehydrogenase